MNELKYPKKIVITVGKPGASKDIHVGHLSGGMITADIFARFLKNRIGIDNVLLLSATECYGTAIEDKFKQNGNKFGTISEYITHMHQRQLKSLKDMQIGFSGFYCMESDKELKTIHTFLTRRFVETLIANDDLELLDETILVDGNAGNFLNYRQIESSGIQTYVGQKYNLNMDSNIMMPNGEQTEIKQVKNYFINLVKRKEELRMLHELKYKFLGKYTKELLEEPKINIAKESRENVLNFISEYIKEIEETTKKVTITLKSPQDYKNVVQILDKKQIKYEHNKFLDKCRLTSDANLGIDINIGDINKKMWVWIDSLIAPISYTMKYLRDNGMDMADWKFWWCDENADIYHFMAEDNIFFYTIVENFLFLSWNENNSLQINNPKFSLTPMRVLFNGSYSGKFPTADMLLNKYTPEQLRYSIGAMGNRMSSFNPQKLLDDSLENDDITKRYNSLEKKIKRLTMSVVDKMKKDGTIGIASDLVVKKGCEIFEKYEQKMMKMSFNNALDIIDENMKELLNDKDSCVYNEKLVLVMLHPFLPEFTERIYFELFEDNDIFEGYTPSKSEIKLKPRLIEKGEKIEI